MQIAIYEDWWGDGSRFTFDRCDLVFHGVRVYMARPGEKFIRNATPSMAAVGNNHVRLIASSETALRDGLIIRFLDSLPADFILYKNYRGNMRIR